MELTNTMESLFTSIEEKLRHEITVLKSAMAKIDRYSDNPSEQWVYPIYERILERRTKLLSYLSA